MRTRRRARLPLSLWLANALLGAACAWGPPPAPSPAESRAASARGDALMRQRDAGGPEAVARAEAAYREALRLDAGNAGALVGLAWVHGAEHAFAQSAAWAGRALALSPDHPRAHGLLGDAALELGDLERAATHYQKMLDLRPGLPSYSRAALLLERLGEKNRALVLMQRAIEAGGGDANARAWCRAQRARMLWRRGALAAAQHEIDRALEPAPDGSEVRRAAGLLAAAVGNPEAAAIHYERVVAQWEDPVALAALGDVYTLLGRVDEAEARYQRAADAFAHQPGHGAVGSGGNLAYARFLADRGRELERAEREALAAHEAHPSQASADALAWIYHKQGRHDEALRSIHQALTQGPREAEVLFHSGLIHAAAGRPSTARRHLHEAVSANPRFHPLHAARAFELLSEGPPAALRRGVQAGNAGSSGSSPAPPLGDGRLAE